MVFFVYTTGVPLIFELVIMYMIIKSVMWLLTVHYKLIYIPVPSSNSRLVIIR